MSNKFFRTTLSLSLVGFLCTACTSSPTGEYNRQFDATLWFQASAEYQAATTMIYKAATSQLANNCPVQKKSAVVMDIDETVLDNSPYQAKQISLGQTEFDVDLWNQWVESASAEPLPGVLAYIRSARECGYRVFFVTNRLCESPTLCTQQALTKENLDKHGLDSNLDDYLLRNGREEWGGDKESRRQYIRDLGYDIAFLFGDDLNDFMTNVRDVTAKDRLTAIQREKDQWGSQWFVLPNPMYGSWKRVLDKPHSQYLTDF